MTPWLLLATSLCLLQGTIKAQRRELPEICHLQADICFVIDSSGSINDADPGNYNRVKSFMRSIVDRLEIGKEEIRISAVTFANRGNVEFGLNRYFTKEDVKNAIDRIGYSGGNTNTSGGLYQMRVNVFNESDDRPNVPNTVICITDGVSTVDANLTIPMAQEAHRAGIRILAVGIGDEVNMDELRGIASPPVGNIENVFTVGRFDKLEQIFRSLVTLTCFKPTLPPTTTPSLQEAADCREQVDVAFLLDASGSIQAHNFDKMLDFMKRFIEDLDIDTGTARVALLTFSDSYRLEWHFNTHDNRRDMIDSVTAIKYSRGSTNTASALRYAHSTIFSENNGDRLSARNVIVLVTDGQSNDRQQTLTEAKAARDKDIHIFVAGIGSWLDELELDAIATYPHGENRFRLSSFDNLDRDFRVKLRNLVCNNENECLSNPCRNELRCNDMLGSYWCSCSQRYGGTRCEAKCENHADIIFALDASGSIGRDNFQLMQNFITEVIAGLRIGTPQAARRSRVGVMTFANEAEILFQLRDYDTKFRILNALPPYYTGGTTNTADAIRVAREVMFTANMGDQQGVPNILVVITDGKSNDESETWQMAMEARESGIHIIAIGVGNNAKERELQAIASSPIGSNALKIDSFEALGNIRDRISASLCNNVNECTRGDTCRNGGRCVDMIGGFECICRDGYTGNLCERRCDGKADIAFLLDASGSIHHERFPIVQDFVMQIISSLEVSQSRARIALVSWSDNARLDFLLNRFKSRQDVIQAVHYTRYIGEKTHTASALRMMTDQVFSPANGDREDVPNFAFIITDGNSNINEQKTIEEAIRARQSGVHVFVVSVGKQINVIELKGMASEPINGNIYEVERFQDLRNIIERMPAAICNDVNECNSNPCRNGGQCVNDLKRYFCRCPEGRVGYNCEKSCRRQLDVTFLLDLSGSVESQYDRTIAFTKQVVYDLDMTFGRTRVAIVTFGDQATIAFDLLAYREKEEVLNALSFFPNRGQTNTQAAIQRMRQDIFTSGRGDRAGVQNVGILVTDGYSNVARHNTIPEAERAKSADTALYVVAIGDEVDMGEVNSIAGRGGEPPDSYVFRVRFDGEIQQVAAELAERLCQ